MKCVTIKLTIVNILLAEILEEPKAQYAVIGKNVTFTCNTIGIEAFWVLNAIPMTITYEDEKKTYEDQGVTFLEEITQRYYNLTMIVEASLELNNTVIFCSVVGEEDFTIVMSQEVQLVIFNFSSKYYNILKGLGDSGYK